MQCNVIMLTAPIGSDQWWQPPSIIDAMIGWYRYSITYGSRFKHAGRAGAFSTTHPSSMRNLETMAWEYYIAYIIQSLTAHTSYTTVQVGFLNPAAWIKLDITLTSITGHARSPNLSPIDRPYTRFYRHCSKFGSRLLRFRDIAGFYRKCHFCIYPSFTQNLEMFP